MLGGGEGSGKSHFFAERVVVESITFPGLRTVCIRETLRSLKESSKLLIEDKIQSLSVGNQFRVLNDRIETPGDGVVIFVGMADHTAESIKSLEGFSRAWLEEAQTISERSLSLLRPTIRRPGSEIWASWNPRRKVDAIDLFLRVKKPDGAIVVKANWRDNPWFPQVLEDERKHDLELYPDRYEHTWEGDYAKAFEGAYFSQSLAAARAGGRIGRVAQDPLLPVRAVFDLGGSGASADAMAIWIVQWVNREIRVLDYIEGVGQVLAYYVNELRSRGWGKALCILPHDGVNENNITGKRYLDHLSEAGFDVTVIPNQGKGAAMMRIEAARRLFPQIWFNESTTEAGRDALGFYHERKDEARDVGLGPDHDWSSHCFTGDTKVLTRYGTYQIKDLPETGEVLTPCGWKAYRNPRVTRRDAPLVEVAFKDGLTVRCTPDHMFLTASGWRSAEQLQRNTPIQSSLTLSRNISTAVSTVFGQATATLAVAAESCTGMFGRLLLAAYQILVTSTIAMETHSTMRCTTSNALMRASTFPRHGNQARAPNMPQASISARPQDKRPLSGTAQRQGGFGTVGTPSNQRVGQSGSVSRALALPARPYSKQWFARTGGAKFIAARLARLLRTVSGREFGPRIIASVKKLNLRDNVWCLTVPDGESFSLANGAVVHNCADAFGLMCVAYEVPTEKKAWKQPSAAWVV